MARSTKAPVADGNERSSPGPARRFLLWLRQIVLRLVQLLLISWGTLAIYFSNLPWFRVRLAFAILFAGFGVWALWRKQSAILRGTFAAVFLAIVVWWFCIPPSSSRDGRTDVAVLPRASINGDRAELSNVRNFNYRSESDFDVRYEQCQISLAHLVSVDLFVSYWKVGPIAHTFVSFNSDDGTPPVCISIEIRPTAGEAFNPLASMFRQYELINVVGDERDIVRVRTNYRHEDVFLYHTRATPEQTQQLFRLYLGTINQLVDRPQWYNLFSNSCTVNILRYSRQLTNVRRSRFDYRRLLNGFIDRYLYGAGVLDTNLEFDELRRRSHINEAARAADGALDFSSRIRASLPAVDAGR